MDAGVRRTKPTRGTGRGGKDIPACGYVQAAGRLEELVEHGHNGDADDQQHAEFDGQFLFHLLDVAFQFLDIAFQFNSGDLKVGLDFVYVML